MLGRRNHHSIDVLQREQLIEILNGARSTAEVALAVGRRALSIPFPEIADCDGLDVVLVLQTGGHHVQPAAAVADPDVAERDAIVRAEDAIVGERARSEG